ncbi:hypothetical protein ACERK3_15205 [Phycisphaerales bacterium AB-hyl4]|uniref:Mandelate racemase n=1 Tax=Natronomicrosphaera hydrolytica TaxID=3242702 RepID=A0ABV4U947_9BACT
MPFRYGIATLTELPHLIVRARVRVAGQTAVGYAAEGLSPKWFTKHADEPVERELADLWRVIRNAAEAGTGLSAPSVFALWHRLYQTQSLWAETTTHPPLLWNLGVAVIERAVIDAFCRATGDCFAEAVRRNTLGIELGEIHKPLAGASPADLLPAEPSRRMAARHTVGLADPIDESDLNGTDRLDDGLPQTLEQAIAAYGLTHFKIKLVGKPADDLARLKRLASVICKDGRRFAFTLDGNETYQAVEPFRELTDAICSDKALQAFMKGMLFIEQPFHRRIALGDEVQQQLLAWKDRPTIIIDESDATLHSLPRALDCGYAGTSHKNCKGVFKGIAGACLLAHLHREEPGRPFALSGEDLSNVGPIALTQDLAVMATLGLDHVERNGHHYFKGLTMFPDTVGQQMLKHHGDLYHAHEQGYAAVKIDAGELAIDSVVDAPFGTSIEVDPEAMGFERV